ncbi:MAG: HEAT repeat domain-containing protein [Anaerolineales bacterium]|nr:HEAT repeat domain-containing protein [Anaerolineales bacterium]
MNTENKKSLIKRYWKWILGYGFLVLAGTFTLFFISTCAWIGYSVKEKCQAAQEQYGGSCTAALIQYLEDEESHSLKERNQAVWALGQIGDPKALPPLKKYYTGEVCRHDKILCQWELEKAISLTDGGFNATAWMWRKGLD